MHAAWERCQATSLRASSVPWVCQGFRSDWTLPRRGAPSQATSVQRTQPATPCGDVHAPHTCFGTLPRPVQGRMLRAEDLRSNPEQLLVKTCFGCLPSASQGLLLVYPLTFPRTGLESGRELPRQPTLCPKGHCQHFKLYLFSYRGCNKRGVSSPSPLRLSMCGEGSLIPDDRVGRETRSV